METRNSHLGNRKLDRALGVLVMGGFGIYLVRYLYRSLERSSNLDENSWVAILLDNIRSLIARKVKLSMDKLLYRGSCHCRSIAFEFQGPSTIVARDGQGKIHYPHIGIHTAEFKFLTGKEFLRVYYIFVPARGSKMGVEPETAAFTFCSQCGTHILHAPSSHSTILDVNTECLDAGSRWSLSKDKHNLSQGVPCSDQVLPHYPSTDFVKDDEIESVMHASFPNSKYGEFHQAGQHVASVRIPTPTTSKVHSKVVFPGTPSTSSTSITEPIPYNGQSFGIVKEEFNKSPQAIMEPFILTTSSSHQYKRSHSSDSIPSSSTTLEEPQITHVRVPSFGTEFSSGDDSRNILASSIQLPKSVKSSTLTTIDTKIPLSPDTMETCVTPQTRDRLHLYMKKHLSSDKERPKISTPRIANLNHDTESKSESMDKI